MELIDFAKIFKFDDTTNIDEAIAKIERLGKAMQATADLSEKAAADYSHALNDIAKSAAKLDSDVDKLDETLEEHQELILKSATQAEKLLKSQEATAAAMEAERITAEKLKAANDQLTQAKEKLNQSTIKEAGSIAALKAELGKAVKEAENMGDATDQVVKKEALARVSELAKSVNTADAALKQAKKGVDIAAGSYDALQQEVEKAKKQLKAMEGGIGSNTAEFKQLQKTVNDGTEKLKEFDEGIGDNRRNVGGYAGDIRNVIEEFGAFTGMTKTTKKALDFLSKTPVLIFLTALAAAVGAVTAYFKGSVEGQDDFNRVMRIGEAIIETFMDLVEDFGKILFDAITQPKKTLQELWDLAKPVRDAVVAVFEDPVGAIKALGDLIVENVINRIKSVGVLSEGVALLLEGKFTAGFKKVADAGIQAATGITNATDKIASAVTGALDAIDAATKAAQAALLERIALAERIATLENQIRKDKIADIVDDAKTEVQVNQLITKSQDKLKFSAEQRFAAIRLAGKLSKEQLEGDLALIRSEIELQKLNIKQIGDTYEEREKLAQLQAQELGLQAEFERAAKKRQVQEISLIREIEKELLDSIARQKDAQRQLNDVITNSRISSNKEIIEDERTTLDDRLALLNENADFQIDLAESARNAELAAAKETALQRINLSSETLEAIYNNETLSINERIAQERTAKEELLSGDQAYIDTVTRLNQQFKDSVVKINEETTTAASDNVFKQWARDYQKLIDTVGGGEAADLLGLETALQAGNISLKEYQDERARIQEEAQIASLNSQLAYLEKLTGNAAKAGYDTSALERQVSETRLAIAQAQNAKLLLGEQELQNKLKELKAVAYETALTIIDSANEAEDMRREEKLLKLEENYNNELLMAGDNEAAKAAITNQYNIEKDKIDKEQRAADRKRAIFQKTLAIVEIAINTARGIGMALGTFPPPVSFALAAVVGVIGALQIAAVLSKPIPAFAEGTDYAPGGWSLVAEKGPEAVTDSKGTRVIERPSIVDLERGARVATAEETARMREVVSIGDNMIAGFDDDTQKMRHIKLEIDTATMTSALGNKLDNINNTLLNKKSPRQDNRGLAREIVRGFEMSDFVAKEYK
jgi:hypothetical protein